MQGECPPLLIEGSRRGLKIFSEIYLPLSTERVLAPERRDSDWEPGVPDIDALRREVVRRRSGADPERSLHLPLLPCRMI